LRRAETGDFQAKPNQPPGNGHKLTDWEKFRKFAKAHGDKTQVEMAALWEGEVSARTISRALKKIGFTRKKRPTPTANALEAKRQEFVKQLTSKAQNMIVYVDEAGMDNRDDYAYGWNELLSALPCAQEWTATFFEST